MTYCVYILFHPKTNQPCYIGSGQKDRWKFHSRYGVNHQNKQLAALYRLGELPVVVICENLTKIEANRREAIFIETIGNGEDGPLINIWKGSIALGVPKTENHREKIRQALLGHSVGLLARQKISEASKGKPWTEARRQAYLQSRLH